MKNVLVEQMSQFIDLTEEQILAIEESFPIKEFSKGTYLLKQGQIAQDAFLIIKGCIRCYSIVDGEEVTLDFFMEGDSVADFNSLANQKPSQNYLTCSEDCTLAIINAQKEKLLYNRFPSFETICRIEFEKLIGKKWNKKEEFLKKTPEEKYLYLLEKKANLLNRAPQYQIASYLGIKPETLSRIRKRVAENKLSNSLPSKN